MICNELIVAEKVIFDQIGQQVSIIGFWSDFINFAKIPAHPNFMIFISFKDDIAESKSGRIEKKATLQIKLNERIIREDTMSPSFDDPHTLSFSVIKLERLKIEEIGHLDFEVIIENDNKSIKTRKFLITNNKKTD